MYDAENLENFQCIVTRYWKINARLGTRSALSRKNTVSGPLANSTSKKIKTDIEFRFSIRDYLRSSFVKNIDN